MKKISISLLVFLAVLTLLLFSCSSENTVCPCGGGESLTDTVMFVRLVIYEQTGDITMYSFNRDDPKIYEKLETIDKVHRDFGTGGCEYYDVYFSDHNGNLIALDPDQPLPAEFHITLVCNDLNCNNGLPDAAPHWGGAGNNLDAVGIITDGDPKWGWGVVRYGYGFCDEPSYMNEWPPKHALGEPDAVITKMGGGTSYVTIKFKL